MVTWGLILLNGLVFLYELALPAERLEALFQVWGMVPAQLRTDPGAAWTLLTCTFLHGGWTHILGNMWTLYIFGDNVEDRVGPARYLLFYLLCGLAAGATHFLSDPNSQVPTIGASGAIAGVLGAYFVLFPTARVITLIPVFFLPLFVEIPAVVFIGVWFVSQLFNGTLALVSTQQYEGVAWWAHVGGFVVGFVLLPLFKKTPQQYRRYYADEHWPW